MIQFVLVECHDNLGSPILIDCGIIGRASTGHNNDQDKATAQNCQ
jgi:hypothetical protein